MKISSFILEDNKLHPIEVELSLWPGLPEIHFLGLPSQHLRESALRIKSAIKAQGFDFPQTKQILVNLRPSYVKKNSRGVELAVAALYLWVTGQVPPPTFLDPSASAQNRGVKTFVYGELGLDGVVYSPEELYSYNTPQGDALIMTGPLRGPGERTRPLSFQRMTLENLRNLLDPTLEPPERTRAGLSPISPLERPQNFMEWNYSQEEADFMALVALGGHSALLAGPSGSGKSVIAKSVHALSPSPSEETFPEIQDWGQQWGVTLDWKPLVMPHHTTPLISMVGGGTPPRPGEISRAHGGVLILDELLEFSQRVIEALRGPFEEGQIRVARRGQWVVYPARTQILATTNLCPCGQAVPPAVISATPSSSVVLRCRFSLGKCRSYSQRLSGPLVDRFEILHFTQKVKKRTIPFKKILNQVLETQEWIQREKLPLGPESSLGEITKTFSPIILNELMPITLSSERRRVATLRVARTLASLDRAERVGGLHLCKAQEWTHLNFQRLERWEIG